MRFLALFLLLFPLSGRASFLFHYGLNYSSENDQSDSEYEKSRTFHKILLGASVDGKKTVFFGWNINKWSSSLTKDGGDEDNYSLLEMGPKFLWFLNENYNWYVTGEWNPYARGQRTKAGEESDITGSSMAMGLGYRFRISRYLGLGAGIHYHTLSISEEKIDSTENDVSDKVTNLMPMLELSILTK